jgi:hypothetical protein
LNSPRDPVSGPVGAGIGAETGRIIPTNEDLIIDCDAVPHALNTWGSMPRNVAFRTMPNEALDQDRVDVLLVFHGKL